MRINYEGLARDVIAEAFRYDTEAPNIPVGRPFHRCQQDHTRDGGYWFSEDTMRSFRTHLLDAYGPVFAFSNYYPGSHGYGPGYGTDPGHRYYGVGFFQVDSAGTMRIVTVASFAITAELQDRCPQLGELDTADKANRLARAVSDVLKDGDPVPFGGRYAEQTATV